MECLCCETETVQKVLKIIWNEDAANGIENVKVAF